MEASACYHSWSLFIVWSHRWHYATAMPVSSWYSRSFHCECESWVLSLESQRQSLTFFDQFPLTPQVFSLEAGITSSWEVWKNLEQRFSSTSRAKFLNLKLELQSLKKGSDTVNEFLQKIKIARDKLLTVGVVVDNEELLCVVLRGLPKEFAHFCSAIRTRSDPITY